MYNNTCHCEERKRRSNLIICLITLSLFVTLNLFQGLVTLAADYTFTTIDYPGAYSTWANGINNTGVSVGTFVYGRGPQYQNYGFVREVDGSYRKIVFPGSIEMSAHGINDAGQVVGMYASGGTLEQGFLLSDGIFTTIAFSGAFAIVPMGICNTGKIVGYYWGRHGTHGFLLDGGIFTTIDFPGATFTWVNRINDAGQIVGQYGDGTRGHGFLADPIKLFVTIPGINDDGSTMLTRAANMFCHDFECTVGICEADSGQWQVCNLVNPSDEQVRQKIKEAAQKAKQKGKDVIVNIDMDLENFTLEYLLPPPLKRRWVDSVKWAGRMANIVSDAFTKEVSGGERILYAHSAGGDATYQTILQGPKKSPKKKPLYDNVNIFNGRADARKLVRALKTRGYSWWQVKVFTNDGDCPANPLWGLANYDVAKRSAGKS